jgi:hypothetical protein
MKNLDQSAIFMEAVVDPNRRVKDLANAGTFGDRHSDSRKISKDFNVIEKNCAEPFGSAG